MTTSAQMLSLLSYIALSLGIIGTALLAYALDKFVNTTIFAVDALATSIESIATPGDVYVFGGLDVHLKRAKRRSAVMTRIGLVAIALSVGVQAFVLWAQ